MRKPSFWVPLAVALFVGAVLAVVLKDPFGAEFAAYVQAVTTLVFAAVTTSYVLLTYKIAETGEAQLELSRSVRHVDAFTELWNLHCELQEVATQVFADIRLSRAAAEQNINDYVVGSESRRARFAALRSFEHLSLRAAIHMSDADELAAIQKLVEEYRHVAFVGETLDNQLHGAIRQGTSNGLGGFDAGVFAPRWNGLAELVYDDLPTWDGLRRFAGGRELRAASLAFMAVAKRRLGSTPKGRELTGSRRRLRWHLRRPRDARSPADR